MIYDCQKEASRLTRLMTKSMNAYSNYKEKNLGMYPPIFIANSKMNPIDMSDAVQINKFPLFTKSQKARINDFIHRMDTYNEFGIYCQFTDENGYIHLLIPSPRLFLKK